MSTKELTKQLAKKIIQNLGLNTNQGICNRINLIDKKLKIQDDNVIKEYEVYCAEANKIQIIAVNINTKEIPDYVIACIQDDVVLAIRYCENGTDHGTFFVKNNATWVDMSTLYKLNLCACIELITQEGYFWGPIQNSKELYNLMVSILSEEDQNETNDFV